MHRSAPSTARFRLIRQLALRALSALAWLVVGYSAVFILFD
ncbi:hypothetical protein OOT46_12815 [Aquabacterium sp. A7-Y]|nr:hypothetical protein [Aquabacterium sp. A7-Y]MCW7538723.1 hypothetical protein [Aquabacterium sp. A7-Y]